MYTVVDFTVEVGTIISLPGSELFQRIEFLTSKLIGKLLF